MKGLLPDRLTRRRFLKATAPAAGAGILAAQAPALLRAGALGGSEALSVGLVGCGSRGPYVGYVFEDTPGVDVTALCDLHATRLEKAKKQMDGLGSRVTLYRDYRKLLEQKGLDAVIVATNGHWHVLPAIHACEAGKDVYLEKPVGTSIGEGRAAILAARKHGRIVQMGMQQRSWDHYPEAVEIVRSGALGEISHVHVWDMQNFHPGFGSPPDGDPPPELDWDFWVGPSPRVRYNPNRYEFHYWFFDYGGGWEVAWGAHHYDIVHWALGVRHPVAATGTGGHFAFRDFKEWPDTFNGACEYPAGPVAKNGFLLTYTLRSGCAQPVEGRGHGKAFYGTNGMLILNRQGYEVRSETRDGKKVLEENVRALGMKEHDAVRKHVKSFVESVHSRRPPVVDVERGHEASNPGHLMNIAWRLGRRVTWDARTETIPGDPEANALVSKKYRAPWRLPG